MRFAHAIIFIFIYLFFWFSDAFFLAQLVFLNETSGILISPPPPFNYQIIKKKKNEEVIIFPKRSRGNSISLKRWIIIM